MICEFEAWWVCVGVLEVDDDEALVLVCGEEEGGFTGRGEAEDVAVLSLRRGSG